MRFLAIALAFIAATLPVLGAPRPLVQVEKYRGETTGRYIIKLKDGVAVSSITNSIKVTTTHEWNIFNGFATKLDESELEELQANPNVKTISEDGIMYPSVITAEYKVPNNLSTLSPAGPSAIVTQTNAPWGLERLSTAGKLTNRDVTGFTHRYTFDSSAGSGVDIYIVDTGVSTSHVDFGGRARWGATFGPYPSEDVHGHGTHCAGTAAGSIAGVAKNAEIIAVKVLGAGDRGSGTVADIISGLNFVYNSARSSLRPSIASLSLGGGISTTLDDAVAAVTNAGIHVVVAAGNDNIDATNVSPARAPSAITVGATNIDDARASFSNYGAILDIFAPGESILSAWIGSTTAAAILSGTSMATPHISGLVATLISSQGNLSPSAMVNKVRSLDRKGIISNIPAGTVNELAQNGLAPV